MHHATFPERDALCACHVHVLRPYDFMLRSQDDHAKAAELKGAAMEAMQAADYSAAVAKLTEVRASNGSPSLCARRSTCEWLGHRAGDVITPVIMGGSIGAVLSRATPALSLVKYAHHPCHPR